jgi:hypothetical protein
LKELGGGGVQTFSKPHQISADCSHFFCIYRDSIIPMPQTNDSVCLIKGFYFLYTHKSSKRRTDALSASAQVLEKIHNSFQLSATNVKRLITPLLITVGSPPPLSA